MRGRRRRDVAIELGGVIALARDGLNLFLPPFFPPLRELYFACSCLGDYLFLCYSSGLLVPLFGAFISFLLPLKELSFGEHHPASLRFISSYPT